MSKQAFKNGDEVVRTDRDYHCVQQGKTYTVDKQDGDNLYLKGVPGAYKAISFAKSTTSYLKGKPWFIAVNGKEHSRIAQEWLFEQGLQWAHYGKVVSFTDQAVLTNVDAGGIVRDYIIYSDSITRKIEQGAHEVKVLGRISMVLEKVELPVVESPQEKQIRELEETIQKAQKQIDALKQSL